jgi:hypothetical protein
MVIFSSLVTIQFSLFLLVLPPHGLVRAFIVQAGRPEKSIFFGQHLSRDY